MIGSNTEPDTIAGKIKHANSLLADKEAPLSKSQLIKIKIVDGEGKIVETFVAEKKIILEQMKYFQKHIRNDSGQNEIIDIQVQCDAQIFKFLLDYCTELKERGYVDVLRSPHLHLTPRKLFPILVSSDFLQIDQLMKDCLVYWTRNFQTVMMDEKLPVGQLDSDMVKKLTEAIPYAQLLQFVQKEHANGLNQQ